MKSVLLSIFFLLSSPMIFAQKIDSVFFNLYTDSLKKGTHNYINVVGKYDNGRMLPLSNKEIIFSSDYGSFDGNSLVLPENPTVKKVTVTISLKNNKNVQLSKTIFIKIKPDDEPLKTSEEILGTGKKKAPKKSKKKEKESE